MKRKGKRENRIGMEEEKEERKKKEGKEERKEK